EREATLAVGLSASDLDDALGRWRPRLTAEAAMLSLRQARRFAVSLVVPGDALWPEALDDLDDAAPHALWVRGRVDTLRSADRAFSLVGARAATGYGEHVAVEAASGLVDRGYAIVSGAAYGIDGVAHRAALASRGDTIAVLAGGLDRYYPSGHEALLTRISETGAVVAEVPCGTAPTKWRFLQRNRIIAALGLATVVVEAGSRSGSLNTAGHAAQLGRPLGAVPGPVTSSASAGCHRLLREYDAVCVTTPDEMAELAPLPSASAAASADADASSMAPARDAEGARIRLLDALSARSPRSVPTLAAASGLAPDRIRAELGMLELDGAVRERGDGWVKTT
ncbi:MAG: DNA-processing protein DprA, partial [Microbacteriaceae bacterium]